MYVKLDWIVVFQGNKTKLSTVTQIEKNQGVQSMHQKLFQNFTFDGKSLTKFSSNSIKHAFKA